MDRSFVPVLCPRGKYFTITNKCAVSSDDFPSPQDDQLYLLINGKFIVSAQSAPEVPRGSIAFPDIHRSWMFITIGSTKRDLVKVSIFRSQNYQQIRELDVRLEWYTPQAPNTLPIKSEALTSNILAYGKNLFLAKGQILVAFLGGHHPIKVTIDAINSSLDQKDGLPYFLSDDDVIIHYQPSQSVILQIDEASKAMTNMVRPIMDFENLPIGGLDDKLREIFRRAFLSRSIHPALAKKKNINHARGLLLHGSPGTGKTLIARNIARNLASAHPPLIVNGPELLNKFVGQSEENVRKLFAPAEKELEEKGDMSDLHIIVFDELDALCKARGSGSAGGTGAGDGIVNTLLTKLDGINELTNIFVIGMTNRLDLIDEALIRPGRLEILIEIHLPSEQGRLEILNIHTKTHRQAGDMADDISLEELAKKTVNYSGAEIAGLVQNAVNFTLERAIDKNKDLVHKDLENEFMIGAPDFDKALDIIKPQFGGGSDEKLKYLFDAANRILPFSKTVEDILHRANFISAGLRSQDIGDIHCIALYGPVGSGKTAVAGKIAQDSGIRLIQVIDWTALRRMDDLSKRRFIDEKLLKTDKVHESVFIIENLDKLVDYFPGSATSAASFNAGLLSMLLSICSCSDDKKRLVIFTLTNLRLLESTDSTELFDELIHVPAITDEKTLIKAIELSGKIGNPAVLGQIGQLMDKFIGGIGKLGKGITIRRLIKILVYSESLPELEKVNYVYKEILKQMGLDE